MAERAVEDLLKYCENPDHDLTVGVLLAPTLLGRELEPASFKDLADLVAALRSVLWAELERLRRAHGVPPASPNDPAYERLQADLRAGHEPLRGLSIVWARYIDRREPKQLVAELQVSKSTFYDWLSRGVREAATVLHRLGAAWGNGHVLREVAPELGASLDVALAGLGEQLTNGQVLPFQVDRQPTKSGKAMYGNRSSPKLRSDSHAHVVADTVIVFRDNARLMVTNTPEQSTGPVGLRRELDRLQAALIALFMLVVGWAMLLTPRVSIGGLLLFGVWRVGAHVVHARREKRLKATELFAWHLALLLAWFVVLGLLIVVVLQLPWVLADGIYSSARLGLILRGLCISVGMLILGAIDGLRWTHSSAPPWGPWQNICSHADWVMLNRWDAVTYAWLAVGMLVVIFVLAGTF